MYKYKNKLTVKKGMKRYVAEENLLYEQENVAGRGGVEITSSMKCQKFGKNFVEG